MGLNQGNFSFKLVLRTIYTLKSAGIDVTTAAKLMEHSNPMMTLKVYTQVKDDETHLADIELAKYIFA